MVTERTARRRNAALFFAPLAALFAAVVAPEHAAAADADGKFAIKDAGAQTCGKFAAAWDEGSADIAQYAGWVAGYVTAFNQFNEGAYDLTPWQSTQTLLGMTYSICGQMEAETRFLDAFAALARQIAPMRLQTYSELEGVRRGERAMVVYDAVLGAAKRRLAAEGFEPGPDAAEFDQQASDAFAGFQEARGLEPSGLPDQETLFELFMKPTP